MGSLVNYSLGILGIFLEIGFQCGRSGLGNGGNHLPVAEFRLGLAFELRFCYLYGNHSGKPFPEIVGRKVELQFGKEIVFLRIVLEGPCKSHLESLKMGTSLYGVDIVYVRVQFFGKSGIVLQGNLYRDDLVRFEINRVLRELLRPGIEIIHEFLQPFLGIEHLAAVFISRISVLVREFLTHIRQSQPDTFVQIGEFPESCRKGVVFVFGSDREDFGIRMESDNSTRIGGFPDHGNVSLRLSLGIFLHEDFAFPVNLGPEIVRKGVHAGYTHSVKTSGNLVAVLAELSSGMKHRQDHFKGRTLFLFMHSCRNTSSVIPYGNGIVPVYSDFYIGAVSGQCLVYTVVHHFIYQMVQTALSYVADVH